MPIDIRARFAKPPRNALDRPADPLLCSRSGPFGGPSPQVPSNLGPPRRSSPRAVSEPDSATAWHRFRTELRRAVAESTWHIWLERVSFRELDGTTFVLDAPDDVRAWLEGRFGRLLTACAESALGPGARVRVATEDEREPPAAPAHAASASRRPGAQPAPHVRPVRDRHVQPARPRRRAGRRRAARAHLQPAVHLRPARPRQDPPAALDRQLRQRARRRADRPLHDGRGVHRPLRRARCAAAATSRRSRPPTAASTCCSSTTSSSSPPRPAPSRSSSTPSTGCTRPAPSSCSPPIACRATSRRSRTGCASASRPAWSATSRPPTAPRA